MFARSLSVHSATPQQSVLLAFFYFASSSSFPLRYSCVTCAVTSGTLRMLRRSTSTRAGRTIQVYSCRFLSASPSLVVTWGLCAGAGSKRLSLRDYHCTLHTHTHTHTNASTHTHTHMYRQFRLNWTTTEFLSMINPTPHLHTSTHPEQKGL